MSLSLLQTNKLQIYVQPANAGHISSTTNIHVHRCEWHIYLL